MLKQSNEIWRQNATKMNFLRFSLFNGKNTRSSFIKQRNTIMKSYSVRLFSDYTQVRDKLLQFYFDRNDPNLRRENALPGEDVQFEMLPKANHGHSRVKASEILAQSTKNYRESAVMILCYPITSDHLQSDSKDAIKCERTVVAESSKLEKSSESVFGFTLTKRFGYKGIHSDEVCLPGGSLDETDGSLQETAERECFEEIGVSNVKVIGQLSPIYIAVSNFLVTPFIALTHNEENPTFDPHPREVKSVINTGIDVLLDDNNVKQTEMLLPFKKESPKPFTVPYFNVGDEIVWGATAGILSEFKHLIKSL